MLIRLSRFALVFLAAFLLTAGIASAHAQLEGSSPERGASLDDPPATVTFTFSEPVESSLGGVKVFNTSGDQIQTGTAETGSADVVGAELPSSLPDGLYTATYQVVSADSHPINGGITFTVGDSSAGGSSFVGGLSVTDLLAGSESGAVTDAGFWFDRWAGFVAMAIAIGMVFWLLCVWGWGRQLETVGPRINRILLPVVLVGIAAAVLAIPLQGASVTGQSFWSAFGSGVPADVVETRFGKVMLLQILAFALLVPFAATVGRNARLNRATAGLALLGSCALVLTPGLAGHASTQEPTWLLLPGNVFHVAGAAIWGGGLLAMIAVLPAATAVVASPSERTRLLVEVTERFSKIAFWVVILIAFTGVLQSFFEVGSFPALIDTAFGRAVSIKVVLFALLLGLGWHNRRRIIGALVSRLEASKSPGKPGLALRRNLRLEVLLIVLTLGVTAALVSYPPSVSESSGPVAGSVMLGEDQVDYTVDPAKLGSNEVHIYLFDGQSGAPVDVIEMNGTFSQPEAGVAPIDMELRKAGPGHYSSSTVALGVKGEWKAEVAIRISQFDEPSASFEFEVE